MKILPLEKINTNLIILEKDENGREITLYDLNDVFVVGDSLAYPNTLLYETFSGCLFKPLDEKIMSLKDIHTSNEYESPALNAIKNLADIIHWGDGTFSPHNQMCFFYFIYNTDNYFHFIYDSLPHLISFQKLKPKVPNLKLLMNYPEGKNSFYKFVIEFLELFGITEEDIEIVDKKKLYGNVFLSNSYTHGINSNLPPRKEVYELFKTIVDKIEIDTSNLPKKIYVSRRSWVHGDLSNIGTNYTSRRKMINEDELVEYLTSIGYAEIFTETLSTKEKIALFANAESVIGAIGGGICNVLFSKPDCKLTAIVSPHFLDVNERFLHSLNGVKLSLFNDTFNTEASEFKKHMRVKCGDIIGEITEINNDELTISYSDIMVSGWNNDTKFKSIVKKTNECVKLDNGLNSAWAINLEKFKKNYHD